MIPLCMVIGDSTAVGAAEALVAQGIHCAVHARVNAPSSEAVRIFQDRTSADRVLIALGSNDPTNPLLARNLTIIRQRAPGSRVTWLAPYHAGASRIVGDVARAFGDTVVWLSSIKTYDRVHPVSYRRVASALQWSTLFSVAPRSRNVSATPPSEPSSPPIVRQVVVLSF